MSDEVTTHQIEGVCEGVMLKGDWQEFHINIGKQYPVKLASKHDDVKDAVAAVGTQEAVWTYTQRDGNPNPHKPGEFYKNRYLSKVEVGGTLDPELAGQQAIPVAQGSTGNQGARMPRDHSTDRSIERQVILKEMVQHYPDFDKLDAEGWWALIGKLDDFMVNGVGGNPVPKPQAQVASSDTPAEAPVNPDDDIPF